MSGKSILLLSEPSLPTPPKTYGGIERIVDSLARGLASKGWDVTLACHPESTTDVRKIFYPSSSSLPKGRLANAARILRETIFHHYDLVHSSAHFDLSAALWPLRQKVVHTFHACPDWNAFSKRLALVPRRNLWFTTVGKHMVKHFENIRPTIGIHNGIRIEEFTYQECVPADAPLVFLGRIEEIKGTHHAIHIARKLGLKLVIAGNRSENPDIDRYFREEVEPHLSEQINYIGPVDSRQKNLLLSSASALLMPIEWDEPFGLVMAESLACGTPVIGINRGAVPEIVEHGITGAVCENVDQMTDHTAEIRSYSRSKCRASVVEKFTEAVMVENYHRFFCEIAGR